MKKIIAISALMAAMASASAMAVDSNLTFQGSVTSGTCVMNASDATKTLTIPDISAAALLAAGGGTYASQSTTQNVTFTSCPGTVSKVYASQITTSGTVYNSSFTSSVIPNNGTATGIHTVLTVNGNPSLPANGSLLNSSSNSATVTNGTAVVQFIAGVRANQAIDSSAAAPTAGTYSDTYTVTFAWS